MPEPTNERQSCTVHHPFDPAKNDDRQWVHPSASQTFDTDYVQYYHCPICGIDFGVELAE